MPESPPFYLNISWSPTQLNAQYISFVVRLGAYEGGANARQEVFTFNYDVEAGKEMSVGDLLGEYDNYIAKLSFYTVDHLMEKLSRKGNGNTDVIRNMIIQGAGLKQENFRNFTFTDRTLYLFYSKYQVAPGAYGEQAAQIPMSIFSNEYQLSKHGLLITSLKAGAEANFPLKVDGLVSGKEGSGHSWVVFEGEAGSMHILNENGQESGMGILKADGDWMTGKPVKVSGVIELEKPASRSIYLEIRENYPANADEGRAPYSIIIPLNVDSL